MVVCLQHIQWVVIENQRLESVTSLLVDFQHPLKTKPNLISKNIILHKRSVLPLTFIRYLGNICGLIGNYGIAATIKGFFCVSLANDKDACHKILKRV